MIKAKLGDRVEDWLLRGLPFLFRRRVDPNLLTVIGALVSLVAAGCFAVGEFFAGGLVMLAGGAFDLLDGVVARFHGISTSFGAFLDSTLDRVVDMALLLGLTAFYARIGEPNHVLLAAYVMAVSVLVSYAQAKAELLVPAFKVGLFERGERIVILAAGALTGWMIPALWVVALGSTVTVVQRIVAAYREMSLIEEQS
ncbi:MAG: CDP-alcohol phosphatidyltransferase family protein [Myxococcota bacterium]|nr:CDP-alcohol phosphatidyltransferase family protein [bacterium]MDP6074964.1 CDP-alcohol phosphatidyltransferase family protein [Myxococcota bacterium]MDP6243102.1 CDP-alcohol phosphatidyltransferase family protein [Myxococcota bacterium]MDP7076277.1 CDP-alcohol phosphatidyltransferase family protein [Myxococcota bacterium]MDP7298076.1 CDP-alcohol phosphatidyltransferase family protein [Myxococcota bacterium]